VGAYIIERKEQLLPFPIQDPPYNTPGDRLRNARYENCMTIVELARRTGLAVETISYLEEINMKLNTYFTRPCTSLKCNGGLSGML